MAGVERTAENDAARGALPEICEASDRDLLLRNGNDRADFSEIGAAVDPVLFLPKNAKGVNRGIEGGGEAKLWREKRP